MNPPIKTFAPNDTAESGHATKSSSSTMTTNPASKPNKSRLWDFRRMLSLDHLDSVARIRYNLSNRDIKILWNKLHDVTEERPTQMEWKTLQTQLHEKDRTDKTTPVVWQQVQGMYRGKPEGMTRLAAEREEQIDIVIETVKAYLNEEAASHSASVVGSPSSADSARNAAGSGPRVEGNQGVRGYGDQCVQSEELGEQIVASPFSLEDSGRRHDKRHKMQTQRDMDAQGESLNDPEDFLTHSAGTLAYKQADDQEGLGDEKEVQYGLGNTSIDTENVDTDNPYGLLDSVSVSTDECLVPPSRESEYSEAMRRAADFYD